MSANKLRTWFCLFVLLAMSSLAACGSSGNGGGSGGSGGSGSSSTSGSGGGPTGQCPDEPPPGGAPCNEAPELECTYGDKCCPQVYFCSGGVWATNDIACAAPEVCPATPPAAGSACAGPCLQAAPCGYACDQGMSVLAQCPANKWEITSVPCSDPVMCGDTTCAPGEVCLQTAGGPGIFSSCQKNPCENQPLSCECASSLCPGGDMYECTVSSGNQVSCSCSMCP